ncbi:zf-TFIIB domain-containing protein [Hyphomonas sp. WL0036]|uniref:TFIIB-type zinc ribbon-containing protein n=1 Tax=Hyphomonas sediminis TaxID=2866160 RepID=UPI001C82443D|nr:zf-TFIIB domain-containing protein [Hyphomonas sediminis]
MKCPVDDETLVMAERNGVEIDYCPKCRGVWLDRGELDKIIDRAATVIPAPAPHPEAHRPEHYRDEDRSHRYDDDDDWKYRKGKRHRRDSFLSDLFDF